MSWLGNRITSIRLDEHGLWRKFKNGKVECVLWTELRKVAIATTDDGPLRDDFFYMLYGATTGVLVEISFAIRLQLLETLQTLDGFDNEAVIQASSNVGEGYYSLWERPAGLSGSPWEKTPFPHLHRLRQHFHECFTALGGKTPDDFYQRVTDPYFETHRHYHTIDHLLHVLDAVEQLKHSCESFHVTRLAAFYHDVVYGKRSNEEKSARFVESELAKAGIEVSVISEVAALVRATKRHAPAQSGNAKVLFDADLSVLGAEPAVYQKYVEGIRLEFSHVPNWLFKRGRKKMLATFAHREPLFHTELARQKWEAPAKRNLRKELSS